MISHSNKLIRRKNRSLRTIAVINCSLRLRYTEAMRRLIVNADDFGLTSGVNRGIIEACEHGIVSSTTLMAKSSAFDEATDLAKAAGPSDANLSVGCHVVLMDGEPVLPPDRVPSLLDSSAANGSRFRENLSDFVLASFRGKLNPAEVEAEANAQFARLQDAGIQPSHFDTHKHAHMFPAVLRPLLRAPAPAASLPCAIPLGRFGLCRSAILCGRGRRGSGWRSSMC